MNLADVFTYLFIILGFVIVYISYWLMAAGLFPKSVERYAEQIGRAPVKTILVGAVLFIPLVALSVKSFPGNLKFVIPLLFLLVALFGSAGLALRIGQGLQSLRDVQEPWRRVLRGGIVLALTFVMPFLGWVVVMPVAFLCGFGAFVIVLFRRKPQIAEENAPTPIASCVPSEPPVLSATAP